MLNIYFTDESKNFYEQMFQEIENQKKQGENRKKYDPVYFVVPKQSKLIAEEAIMGCLGHGTADVITDLTGLINILSGDNIKNDIKKIDSYGIYMLIYKIIKELKGELNIYNEESNITDNVPKIYEIIKEFKKNNTMLEELIGYKNKLITEEPLLSRKIADLAKIYERYSALTEGKFYDAEDFQREFALGNVGVRRNKDKLNQIWILGYQILNNLDQLTIAALVKQGFDVNLILYKNQEGSRAKKNSNLFDMTERILHKLYSLIEKSGHGTIKYIGEKKQREHYEFAHLEENLFSYKPDVFLKETDRIKVTSCADFKGEAIAACKEILRLIREENFKPSDIAIICSQHEDYHSILQLYLHRYELGHFIDENRMALHSPVVEYISALLDVLADGSRQRDVIRLLKTGLTDIESMDRELLENYCISYGITGSRWYKPFEINVYNDDETFEKIEETRQKISDMITDFKSGIAQCSDAGEKIEVLYEFLKNRANIMEKSKNISMEFDSEKRFEEAQEMRQIWDIVTGVMEQMVAIIGKEQVSNKDFRDLLIEGFKHIAIGVVPPTKDQIIIGTPERTKIMNKKAVFFIGANAGILPQDISDNKIINNSDREKIINLGGDDDWNISKTNVEYSNLVLYNLCSRAEDYIFFSYSRGDDDGRPLAASPILNNLKRCFPKIEVQYLNDFFEQENLSADSITGYKSMEEKMVNELVKYSLGEQIDPDFKYLLRWFLENKPEITGKIKEGILHSQKCAKLDFYTAESLFAFNDTKNININEDSDEGLGDKCLKESVLVNEKNDELHCVLEEEIERALGSVLDGKTIKLSPTRLECFSKCPFQHFVKYGLKPKERMEYSLQGYNIGDIYHETFRTVLEELTPRLIMYKDRFYNGEDMDKLTYKKLAKRVYTVMENLAKEYNGGIILADDESKYRLKMMKRVCTANLWALIEQAKAGNIKNMMHEVGFGQDRDIPPIRINAGKGNEVFIEGKIDRVDFLKGDAVKIIDYKSGNRSFSMEEALTGWKLQLMLYLLAVLEQDKNRIPAGVFYYNISDTPLLKVKNVREYGTEVVRRVNLQFDKETRLNGVVSNEEYILNQIDYMEEVEEERSPAVLPVARKKSGGFTARKRDLFKSSEEMAEATEEFKKLIEDTCNRLVNGEIGVEPMQSRSNTACDYCEYKGICHFDISLDGCEFNVKKS